LETGSSTVAFESFMKNHPKRAALLRRTGHRSGKLGVGQRTNSIEDTAGGKVKLQKLGEPGSAGA